VLHTVHQVVQEARERWLVDEAGVQEVHICQQVSSICSPLSFRRHSLDCLIVLSLTTRSTGAYDQSVDGISLPILESHTRQELYDLVLGLAEDSGTYDTLLQLAGEVENENAEPALSTTLVDRSMEIRSSTGYVGLYNPRAICYMNSLLTQLFMNLNFRRFILQLDVKEASGSQRLLFETQRLFAQLQNSFRRSTDPREFAACVKSLDKTPIDITIQMDADEFYNLLFDQWEAQLLKQEHKQKFRSFYGGQTLNQIKSKECEHVSERVEPFFAVQCDIAGKANLQESLQAYVQGDVMEGDNKYKCESCDGKFVDAVKRTCLKDAPDNLIFHLKRFEFDLNDFSRRKIYDHFAFPETLDISPYKAEYLSNPSKPREDDVFDLVGVLVHTGTCENGHYYSYIRQRPSSGESTLPTWIEFNDSEVSPFDPADIADRTFGGFIEADGYTRQIKQYSAYMLFYQRRAAVDKDQRQWVTTSSDCTPQIAIPKFFEQEMNVSNATFIREYSLFDPVHTKFVRQLHSVSRTISHGTCSEDHSQEARALHIVLAHLSHIAWRQYNAEIFHDLLLQLRRSMLSCAVCCSIALQWLAENDDAITNIIIKCTHPRVRSQMRSLVIEGLRFLREKEPTLYGLELSENDMEVDSSASTEGMLVILTRRLRKTADETAESTRGWEDYYLMLTQMAEMGHLETAVLLDEGFLYFCLRLFCMHTYAPFKAESPELARIMEKRRSIFNRLICFMWKLLSQMDLRLPVLNDNQADNRLATLHREKMKFPLSKRETIALGWWSDDLKAISIVDKILEVFDDTKVDHFYPGDIIRWMLESPNDLMQTSLCRTMLEGLTLDPPYCDAYIYAALPFCEACPKGENVSKIINTIAKAIASPNRAAEDRLPGGEAVLRFLAGLLKAENPYLFQQRHPHAFHQILMIRSRTYGVALLCHYEERVRKATYTLFQQLYGNAEAIPPETVHAKYDSARELLSEMIHKFAYEREVGRHLSFMMPLVETCRLLAEQLYILTQSQEPEIQPFQEANDTALIFQFQQEVEARLRSWPLDASTPISQGETYDQSDYASESDDAHDLLDN
jgi:ubiquitin carboxyl-terminal hydrolase 34